MAGKLLKYVVLVGEYYKGKARKTEKKTGSIPQDSI